MSEPTITINGVELSTVEAMTVRVALGGFAIDLSAGLLGATENGTAIRDGYMRCLNNIFNLIARGHEARKSEGTR